MTFSDIYERAGVRRLPVDPIAVASALGIKVMNYKTVMDFWGVDVRRLYLKYPLGFSFKMSGKSCIALNENSCGEHRRRFTAAHEIAHCVLEHLDNEKLMPSDERAAERFAADLLAPLVVLHECGVRSAEEISRVCGISRQAAEIRLERLIGRDRGGFRPDEDEQRVKELFSEFITGRIKQPLLCKDCFIQR